MNKLLHQTTLVSHQNLWLKCLLSRIWKCSQLTLKTDQSTAYIYVCVCVYYILFLQPNSINTQKPAPCAGYWCLKQRNRRSCGLQTFTLDVTSPCTVLWMWGSPDSLSHQWREAGSLRGKFSMSLRHCVKWQESPCRSTLSRKLRKWFPTKHLSSEWVDGLRWRLSLKK